MDTIKSKRDEFIQYCLDKDNHFNPVLPIIQQNKNKEAILIEFRLLPHISFLIKNAIYQLGINWSYTIVCGNNNYDFIYNFVQQLQRDIRIIKMEVMRNKGPDEGYLQKIRKLASEKNIILIFP